MRNKWKPLIDDLNPRHSRVRTPKPVRTLKLWTIKGQVVKEMEQNSPTTHRKLFKALQNRRMVSDTPKGLQSIRRAVRELQRHGIVQADKSTMSQASPIDGMGEIEYRLSNIIGKYIIVQ